MRSRSSSASWADALALEVIERRLSPEPGPTSVDDRIMHALAEAGRPLALAELRADCHVRSATLCDRLAALEVAGRVMRSVDGYCLAGS